MPSRIPKHSWWESHAAESSKPGNVCSDMSGMILVVLRLALTYCAHCKLDKPTVPVRRPQASTMANHQR